jgi:hypothetical protein
VDARGSFRNPVGSIGQIMPDGYGIKLITSAVKIIDGLLVAIRYTMLKLQ